MRGYLFFTIAFCGCGRSSRPGVPDAPAPPSAAAQHLVGKVFATGAEPHTSVTLVLQTGGAVNLLGTLRSELRRLAGATVRVWGISRGTQPGGGFEVRNYDVLLIDGQRPTVGVIEEHAGGTRLLGSDTVWLALVPHELRSLQGTKVWVLGPRLGDTLQVHSYGQIAEAFPPDRGSLPLDR